jgi:hypothetical protein
LSSKEPTRRRSLTAADVSGVPSLRSSEPDDEVWDKLGVAPNTLFNLENAFPGIVKQTLAAEARRELFNQVMRVLSLFSGTGLSAYAFYIASQWGWPHGFYLILVVLGAVSTTAQLWIMRLLQNFGLGKGTDKDSQ